MRFFSSSKKSLFIFLCLMLPTFSSWADCPRYVAPGKFKYPKSPWNGTDTGVVVDGFVDLSFRKNGIYEVAHGVDLSRHNIVDYKEIKDCGGKFSFVRMDDKYSQHLLQLRSQEIISIPYFYFPIPKALRNYNLYNGLEQKDPKVASFFQQFDSIGREAGNKFLKTLQTNHGMKDDLPKANLAGLEGHIVALDVEEKLLDEKNSSYLQRVYFGRFYARAVCSWAAKVNEEYKDLRIILYTTPSVHGDYLNYALEEENKCLQKFPVWVARTTADAGDAIRPLRNTKLDKDTQRLCFVTSGNRCVVHQYSHRATFAAQGRITKKIPPHIDIDRIFTVKLVENEAGFQLVRKDDEFPNISYSYADAKKILK